MEVLTVDGAAVDGDGDQVGEEDPEPNGQRSQSLHHHCARRETTIALPLSPNSHQKVPERANTPKNGAIGVEIGWLRSL